MIDPTKLKDIRKANIKKLSQDNIKIIEALPLLENELQLRGIEEIINRSLAMSGIVIKACHPTLSDVTIKWLEANNMIKFLTDSEKSFLYFNEGPVWIYQNQQECQYSFAYVLGLCSEINIHIPVPLEVAKAFPDIRITNNVNQFISNVHSASMEEALEMLDFYYCLDWYCVDSMLKYGHCKIGPARVRERRRALEWVLHPNLSWDEISLDT